jgi:hypothetical protein
VAHVKQGNKRLDKLEDRSTPMVFIGYESGSKAWRFYNPATKRVHMSRDAVFKEDRAWSWDEDENGDGEPFKMEFVPVDGVNRASDTTRPDAHSGTPSPAGRRHGACNPPVPPSGGAVEHATPPTVSPDLDEDASDAPLRFRRIDDVLGPVPLPGLAEREFAGELLAAIGDEPSSAQEALRDEHWRSAMPEEKSGRVSLGVWTMCRSCAEAFVRPETCVVQRRKLHRSVARQHHSSQPEEHACSGSVARRHGESGRSGGCISKEDGATTRTLQLGAHCHDVQLGSGGRELSTTS